MREQVASSHKLIGSLTALLIAVSIIAAPVAQASAQKATETGSIAATCKGKAYGPDHERDQTGHYLTYYAKATCSAPAEYSLSLILYRKTGNGWTRVDSYFKGGVSNAPYVGGGTECNSETSTVYRVTIEGEMAGRSFSTNGPQRTFPCGR